MFLQFVVGAPVAALSVYLSIRLRLEPAPDYQPAMQYISAPELTSMTSIFLHPLTQHLQTVCERLADTEPSCALFASSAAYLALRFTTVPRISAEDVYIVDTAGEMQMQVLVDSADTVKALLPSSRKDITACVYAAINNVTSASGNEWGALLWHRPH